MQPGDSRSGESIEPNHPAGALGPEINAELAHYCGVQERAWSQLRAAVEQLAVFSDQLFKAIREALESAGESRLPMTTAMQRCADTCQAAGRVAGTSDEACLVGRACLSATQSARAASEQSVESLEQIRPILQSLPVQLSALEEGVRDIENMVTVIADIAQQTNLLSINANIEAARAGDTGVGFARVAERVTELAESAGTASRDLDLLIREIARRNRQAFRDIEDLERTLAGGVSAARAAVQASAELEPVASGATISVERIRAESELGSAHAGALNEAICALKARNDSICASIEAANSIVVHQCAVYPSLQGAMDTLDALGKRHRAALFAPSAAPRREDEYLIDLPRAPLTLDPALAADPCSAQIAAQIYTGLVQIDSNGNPMPALAAAWSVSPDGLTWTFRLRSGALFHNGREIIASDVKYSIERVLRQSTSSPFSEYFSAILGAADLRAGCADEAEGIRVEGEQQITFMLETACPGFLFGLGHVGAGIVPREEIARFGHLFSRTPVGSGAFAFQEGRLEEGVTLRAFSAHIEGRPFLDALKYRVVPSAEERMKNFRHDQTGHLEVGSAEAVMLQRNSGLRGLLALARVSGEFCGVFNLLRDGPLMDPRIRQALNLAVDREALISEFFPEMATPSYGPAVPGHPIAAVITPLAGDSLDEARCLMSLAGYPVGMPVPLRAAVISGDNRMADLAGTLGRMFERIGVSLKVEERPHHAFWDAPQSACDLWLADVPVDCLDPAESLRARFHSDSPLNRGGFCSKSAEGFFTLLRSGHNRPHHDRVIEQLFRLLAEEAPWLFLVQRFAGALVQERIQNFYSDPNQWFPLKRVWVKRRRE